jgi:hypothetical protein
VRGIRGVFDSDKRRGVDPAQAIETFKDDANAIERPKLLRGRKRMEQLASEMRHEIAILSDAMVRGLEAKEGRPATELEKLQSEAICALFLKARKLRDQGKDDLEHLREAAALTSSSAFRLPQDSSPRHHEAGTGDDDR